MKVLSVVGARPQFIKAAAVSRVLRRRHEEILVHTGQHYDDALSGVFFRELGLPCRRSTWVSDPDRTPSKPRRCWWPWSGRCWRHDPTGCWCTGTPTPRSRGRWRRPSCACRWRTLRPACEATIAGMPEEQNRIVADHLAELLLCPTQTAMGHLEREGLGSRALLVGRCDGGHPAVEPAACHLARVAGG